MTLARAPTLYFPALMLLLFIMPSAHAVDSYRFLHVTIETPWAIFIFLLFILLVPFILTAILHWYFAIKKTEPEQNKNEQ